MALETQSMNPTQPYTSHGDPTGKTKETITSFLGRDGEADTTVHETINPAVVKEHVQRANHEERQKIVDREVHQDHHHISVQPVRDQEIQPETHEHNIADVETHEIKHGNDQDVAERLAAERNQFHDTRDVGETQTTVSTGPTVAGEHIHHHVHETIQPVVEKDVIQPHVIHTTYPVHEVHVNEAKHHTASDLPEVTLSEFQRQGGTLAGREELVDSFTGAPQSIDDAVTDSQQNRALGGPGAAGTTTITDSRIGQDRGTQEYEYDTSGRYGQTGATTGATPYSQYETITPSKSQRAAMGGAGAVGVGVGAELAPSSSYRSMCVSSLSLAPDPHRTSSHA
jgi:hypothetical protein